MHRLVHTLMKYVGFHFTSQIRAFESVLRYHFAMPLSMLCCSIVKKNYDMTDKLIIKFSKRGYNKQTIVKQIQSLKIRHKKAEVKRKRKKCPYIHQ